MELRDLSLEISREEWIGKCGCSKNVCLCYLLISGGWIFENTWSHFIFLCFRSFRMPEMVLMTLLSWVYTHVVCLLGSPTGAQYSATWKTRPRVDVLNLSADAPRLFSLASKLLWHFSIFYIRITESKVWLNSSLFIVKIKGYKHNIVYTFLLSSFGCLLCKS